jgi:hypothetical protein
MLTATFGTARSTGFFLAGIQREIGASRYGATIHRFTTMSQSNDSLEEEINSAYREALALDFEINYPTTRRLREDQGKLVQQDRDAWDKYEDLVTRIISADT